MTLPAAMDDVWKPCDLRGVYPHAVSPALFRDIGGAIGTLLSPATRLVVAGDFRMSTPHLKSELIEGLLATGAHVLDCGQGPTPLAYFAAQETRADAVLIVTASHNPPEHNGLKLMLGAKPVTPPQLSEIRMLVNSRNFRNGRGEVEVVNLAPLYSDRMLKRWEHLSALGSTPLVLDAGNGAWSEVAPSVFRDLGFTIACISCVADGRFPDRSPDCARASNLIALRNVVREQPQAIGIAWDGDGDRVAFVDEDGSYVSPDEIAILFAREALDEINPDSGSAGKVVVDLKCSDAVRRAVLEAGGTPLLERTGHAFMRSRMITEEALLGLDACGHYFFRELSGGDDGLFAALFLLDIVRRRGGSLRDLRRMLPRIFSTPELRVPLCELTHKDATAALQAAFPDADVTAIDGLRLLTAGGAVLIRESGTEPVISLRIEGFDERGYEEILERCLAALPSIAGRLQIELKETANS